MKGIAVPYIIALILGIVVIGLLGYWFFVLGGTAGGAGTAQACNAKQAAWCQQWSVDGFSNEFCPSTQFCTSSNDAQQRWQAFAPGCTFRPDRDYCRASFGQSTKVGCKTDKDCESVNADWRCGADGFCG